MPNGPHQLPDEPEREDQTRVSEFAGNVVITPREVYNLVVEVSRKVDGVSTEVEHGNTAAGLVARNIASSISDHEKRIRALEKAGTWAAGLGTVAVAAFGAMKGFGVI